MKFLDSYIKVILLILAGMIYCGFARAQCSLMVNLGEDLDVCSSDEVQLNAQVDGQPIHFYWTPEELVDNPVSLHPTIKEPVSGQVSINIIGFHPDNNLLQNGDFNLGFEGFSSQYELNSNKPGGVIVGALGTELFEEAKPCDDRSGAGLMMMAKVSDTDNIDILCQEIAVEPDKAYRLVAYATGLRTNFPPVIIVRINDEVISSGTLGSFACSWQGINADWNSGSSTTARICIRVSDEDIGEQTDFAMDDMGFYEICEVRDDIDIEVTPFELLPSESHVMIPCGDTIELSVPVYAADPSTISFNWETEDGQIQHSGSDSSILVSKSGTYSVNVALNLGDLSCTEKKIFMAEESSVEDFDIIVPDTLSCWNDQIQVEVDYNGANDQVQFSWSTPDGHLPTGNIGQSIAVDSPGTYIVELLETGTGCTLSKEVEVLDQRLNGFEYDVVPISCDAPLGQITFKEVTGGFPPFDYSIDGGNVFQLVNKFEDLDGGDYLLIVRDQRGCTLEENLTLESADLPRIVLDDRIELESGAMHQFEVFVSIPFQEIDSIEWSPSEGLSCSDCLEPRLLSARPMTYTVTLTDIFGCKVSATVRIRVKATAQIYIPNVFSPNGDGRNDRFVLSAGQGVDRVLDMEIYDRFGNLVYINENSIPGLSNESWDGTFDGQRLNSGIYLYFVNVQLSSGENVRLSGEVLLLH